MDTRNRFQRMYDARYKNAPLSKSDILEVRKRLSDCSVDKINRLSDNYGFTQTHPRTKDKIRMQTSDVVPATNQPRQTYRRAINRPEQTIRATLKEGKLSVEIVNAGRKPSNWKSIWYSGNNRRK